MQVACTKSLTWEVHHAGFSVGFRVNKIEDMETPLSGGYDNMGVFGFEVSVDWITRRSISWVKDLRDVARKEMEMSPSFGKPLKRGMEVVISAQK